MLEVDQLCSGYGKVPVLTNLSLRAAKGEFVGILGHNGMGKSTLLKTLMGQLPVDSGRILLHGKEISKLQSHERAHRGLGAVPQGRAIFPGLSVRQNLEYAVLASGGRNVDERIDESLELFPRLKRLLPRPGGALSGGEQQLLALARCLCTKPSVVLLDEPTEGIQPSICDEIVQTLLSLRDRHVFTLLLVEQDLEFVEQISDRVYLLRKGQITGEVRKSELAGSSFSSEFLGFDH